MHVFSLHVAGCPTYAGYTLVTTGDPEFARHVWNTIFTSLGVLDYDTTIAAVVRGLGWCGMLASVGWLAAKGSARGKRESEMFER